MGRLRMTRLLIVIIVLCCMIITMHSKDIKEQRGVAIVPDSEKQESSEKPQEPIPNTSNQKDNVEQDSVNIHTPDDLQVCL